MRFQHTDACPELCPKFVDCEERIHGAQAIEGQAQHDGTLLDEGEFICALGPDQPATGEGPFCQGRVELVPRIEDELLRNEVETILGPIALDALTDGGRAE